MKHFQYVLTPALLALMAISQPAFAQEQTENAVSDEMFKEYIKVRKDMDKAYKKTIEDSDLSQEEYNNLSRKMAEDSEFRDKVMDEMY